MAIKKDVHNLNRHIYFINITIVHAAFQQVTDNNI